eukprot:2916701-Ditylum_brightwellii.AAC.1
MMRLWEDRQIVGLVCLWHELMHDTLEIVMSPGNLDSSANTNKNDDDVYDKSADRTTSDSSRVGDNFLWQSARQTFELLAGRAL